MVARNSPYIFFFFNDPATTEIYTLSLHDALPIFHRRESLDILRACGRAAADLVEQHQRTRTDRKSTRLNSSHTVISYAVFCLKKKKKTSALSLLTSSKLTLVSFGSLFLPVQTAYT